MAIFVCALYWYPVYNFYRLILTTEAIGLGLHEIFIV